MTAADIAVALGNARREGRDAVALYATRGAHPDQELPRLGKRASPPRRQGCERRAKGADRRQTTGRKALTAFSAPLAIVAW